MPHADSSYVPSTITTKSEFYEHVITHLEALLEGERYWVTNLAQTSAILYHSYLASSLYGGGSIHPVVNWCGFYLHPPSSSSSSSTPSHSPNSPLLLGPYQGRPACLSITPIKGKGVCADGFLSQRTLIVNSVDDYPGHIACDGDTKSEIVVPLRNDHNLVIGVLDLDSTLLSTFDEDDQKGLERVVEILRTGCDWS
ncbi:GAF domain-containing protein [Kwoniella mangroviensis CBS 8886]|nr:GAF domain-containing protein [Kwoniella mangroviensis CBS 8886]